VADQKPPRVAGDERTTLLTLLQYQRESLVGKVDGIDEDGARWSPVATGTSLLWLLRHLIRAEILWVPMRFAGEVDQHPDDRLDDTDTVAAAVADYRATWARVDAIIAASDLDDLCRANDRDEATDLRWVIAHLLEETARHAGHADIIRELLDGQTGR
jgi:hypothetical protein